MRDYPLIKFVVLFAAGIILGKYFLSVSTFIFLLVIVVTLFLILLFIVTKYFHIDEDRTGVSVIAAIIAFVLPVLAGASVYDSNLMSGPEILPKNFYKQKGFTAFGTVTYIELKREKEIVFECETNSIKINGLILNKDVKLIVKLRDESRIKRDSIYALINPGNIIAVTGTYSKGREQRNPGEFDYNKYLNSQSISGIVYCYSTNQLNIVNSSHNAVKTLILDIRRYIDETLTKLQQPQTAALLKGLLISDRSEIDYETKNDFINSGVIHVLAVSGLHVVYILLIFIFLFGRFNPYLRSSLAVIGLMVFMAINGSPASVVRSVIMSIVLIAGFLSNRSSGIYNSLSLSALIILFLNPEEVFNPGFQLSYAAVLSMVIIYPLFNNELEKTGLHLWVKKFLLFLALSISAQIGTLPFIMIYFNKISIIALAANIIVVPISGIIISIGFFTIFLNLFSSLPASLASAVNDLLSSFTLWFVKVTGDFNYAFVPVRQFSIIDAVIFYMILGVILYYYEKMVYWWKKGVLVALAVLNIFILCSLDDKELLTPGKLNVLMIDVGQGDCFLIQFPNGKTALIDAGEATAAFDNGERIIIPLLNYLGIDKIDYGFISHMDNDHFGGFISLLKEGKINHIVKAPVDSSSIIDIKFEEYAIDRGAAVIHPDMKKFNFGNAQMISICNQTAAGLGSRPSMNDKSSLQKIIYGSSSILFTGDAGRKAENYYLRYYGCLLKSNVLKVSHHGSATGSSFTFLNTIQPGVCLISAGIKNKFNLPSPKVIERLKGIHSKVYRTDLEGAVLLQSDGSRFYKEDWR